MQNKRTDVMAAILDCLAHWRVPADPERILATADAVATHKFGDQQNTSETTREIVQLGVQYATRYDKPLICQFPGNLVTENLGIRPACVIDKHLLRPGEYLETEEVNRQIAAYCALRGWKRVILCTHPHHLWRAGLNLKHHGIVTLYPPTDGIDYDSACSRIALRSAVLFIPREIVSRERYLYKDWI